MLLRGSKLEQLGTYEVRPEIDLGSPEAFRSAADALVQVRCKPLRLAAMALADPRPGRCP